MENQLFNCLMANLVGFGKQVLSGSGKNISPQGQNGFLAVLSQKMNGMPDMTSLTSAALGDILSDTGSIEGQDGTAQKCQTEQLDASQMSLFVSSLVTALEQPTMTAAFSEEELSAITEFLNNILEVLSGGDEIELTSSATGATDIGSSGKDAEGKDVDATASSSLMGSLAAFAAALDKMARQDTNTVSASNTGNLSEAPLVDMTLQSKSADNPDAAKITMPKVEAAPVSADSAQGSLQEAGAENPAFLVEVTKSAKENKIIDISMNDSRGTAGFSKPVESGDAKTENISNRSDMDIKNRTDLDTMVIRVVDKEEPDLSDDTGDRSDNENNIGLHANNQRNNELNTPETKDIGKNDFRAMMADKIEKITEQYAGKNMNMDMTVKLKIGDNETVLVGLRDEGSSVTVEVKTANENTMNFLQSQKDDIAKSLQEKNIMTSIHVNIEQDAQGKKQHDNQRGNEQKDAEENQDFGSFFEAMA